MLRRTVFVLAVMAAGAAGLTGQASGQTVTQGAFCSPAGATGVTVDGTPMTCTTTPEDDRNRWRATSSLPVTTTAVATVTTTTVDTSILFVTTTTLRPAATTTTIAGQTTARPAPQAATPTRRAIALTG